MVGSIIVGVAGAAKGNGLGGSLGPPGEPFVVDDTSGGELTATRCLGFAFGDFGARSNRIVVVSRGTRGSGCCGFDVIMVFGLVI